MELVWTRPICHQKRVFKGGGPLGRSQVCAQPTKQIYFSWKRKSMQFSQISEAVSQCRKKVCVPSPGSQTGETGLLLQNLSLFQQPGQASSRAAWKQRLGRGGCNVDWVVRNLVMFNVHSCFSCSVNCGATTIENDFQVTVLDLEAPESLNLDLILIWHSILSQNVFGCIGLKSLRS